MIQYRVSGPLPRGLTSALLERAARVCAKVRGLPKGTAVISIRFVTSAAMQQLNRIHRKKNRPTDVLSFSATEGGSFPTGGEREHEAGDLVICSSYAAAEARRRSMDVTEELMRLIVHGTLHLAGMDHATLREEERMFGLQESLIEHILT